MRPCRMVILASAWLALAAPSHAEPSPPPRTEVAVREVLLSDGTRRYAVPIKVGSSQLLAGLDSGSTGLRILPGVLHDADVQPTSQGDTYTYDAGAQLSGVVANGPVSIGALSGETTVQLVQRVGCSLEKPGCAAGSLPVAHYGIQGDGLPDEGFKAILGVNMASADVASGFEGAGARRWIIELPRPGETGSGRVVLNPTDAEVQGFINLPVMRQFASRRGGAHDAVAGCLVNDATRDKVCGAVVLDTGAPGIIVATSAGAQRPWAAETPATLLFADADGHVRLAESLVIGRREHASHLAFQSRERAPMTLIMSGLTAYFAYSVLYDPEHGTVGFRPRAPAPRGPQPLSVN